MNTPTSKATTVSVPTPIGAAVAACTSRYANSDVAVIPNTTKHDRVFLVATDGRSMAIVEAEATLPSDAAAPAPIAISGDLVNETASGRWPSTLILDGDSVRATWRNTHRQEYRDQIATDQFPPVHEVLPEAKTDASFVWVSLNPQFLLRVAKALGTNGDVEGVTLGIPVPETGKCVHKQLLVSGPCGVGLLMPRAGGEPKLHADEFNRIRAMLTPSCESASHIRKSPRPAATTNPAEELASTT